MKRVALIGIGGMGSVHFNCYKDVENAQVVAVCDVRTDMAKEKVNDENVHIYADFDELLANENVDIVDICTPSYMHKEMSIKALECGKHVLCEKPMSLNSEDTAKIIEAAEKSGKMFMTAHVVRFMRPYIALKQIIEGGTLGKLLRLDMKRISAIPLWSWEDWMRDVSKSGGTPIDLSIHDIDFVQYMFGEPNEVKSVYHKLSGNNDYIISELVYDGFVVSTEGGWYNYEIPFNASFDAVFENGRLQLKDGKLYKNEEELELDTPETAADTGINISNVDGYGGEIIYFVDCVEKGVNPDIVTPESSQNSIKLVERILKNAVMI